MRVVFSTWLEYPVLDISLLNFAILESRIHLKSVICLIYRMDIHGPDEFAVPVPVLPADVVDFEGLP